MDEPIQGRRSTQSDPPHGLPHEVLWTERRFAVHRVQLPLRGGQREPRALLVHPGAVVMLALLDEERVVLIRNHRWTVDRVLLELPAGTCEPDEPPIEGAARELMEETGYRADRIEALPGFWAAPGTSTEWMHVFEATELSWVGQALEADERIEPVILNQSQIRQALQSGEIADAKSIAVLSRWLIGRESTPL
ncbi:MAG TPA: NUDIX hydrolase [Myxococcales bacterium]|nr:hypothetical protein [Myxococcales bacterium]HAN32487.1 NUDIX hydrolase [Myxococcales bacterium]